MPIKDSLVNLIEMFKQLLDMVGDDILRVDEERYFHGRLCSKARLLKRLHEGQDALADLKGEFKELRTRIG